MWKLLFAPTAIAMPSWPLLFVGCLAFSTVTTAVVSYFLVRRERSRLEQEFDKRTALLTSKMESAAASDQAKTDFLAQINHEIRNPLAAILGYCNLIKQQASQTEEFIEGLHSSSQHLNELIDDVLEVAKIESGIYDVDHKSFDLALTVHEVEQFMSERNGEKRVDFSCTIRSLENRFIVSDESKIRQLAINLISNAIKFTSTGKVSAVFDVKRSGHGELATLQFKVIDTGAGIPEAEAGRVFDRFYKCTNNTTGGGSGLGLHVARRIIDAFNGSIDLTSKLDVGTSVIVNIPVKVTESSTSKTEVHRLSTALTMPKILVIDDQVAVRHSLALQLQHAGYESKATASMSEALSTIKSWNPNAVLLDLRMPGGDGFDILLQIRELTSSKSVYVVAITGDASDAVKQECKVAGFDAFLTKPFRLNAVVALMERAGLGLPKKDNDELGAKVTPIQDSTPG